jgi:hypothetical protein
VDEAFARVLEMVDWFASGGQPLAISLPFSVVPVGSWAEAIERCSDQSWEDTTLEARNHLTVFLHTHHRDDYRDWNAITIAAKERLVTPLKERVWQPFAEQHGFGKALVDCVSWDVLAAIMEHEYRDCPGRPEYFLHLLRVYRAGHFPCGWSGVWPAGQLLVW